MMKSKDTSKDVREISDRLEKQEVKEYRIDRSSTIADKSLWIQAFSTGG